MRLSRTAVRPGVYRIACLGVCPSSQALSDCLLWARSMSDRSRILRAFRWVWAGTDTSVVVFPDGADGVDAAGLDGLAPGRGARHGGEGRGLPGRRQDAPAGGRSRGFGGRIRDAAGEALAKARLSDRASGLHRNGSQAGFRPEPLGLSFSPGDPRWERLDGPNAGVCVSRAPRSSSRSSCPISWGLCAGGFFDGFPTETGLSPVAPSGWIKRAGPARCGGRGGRE